MDPLFSHFWVNHRAIKRGGRHWEQMTSWVVIVVVCNPTKTINHKNNFKECGGLEEAWWNSWCFAFQQWQTGELRAVFSGDYLDRPDRDPKHLSFASGKTRTWSWLFCPRHPKAGPAAQLIKLICDSFSWTHTYFVYWWWAKLVELLCILTLRTFQCFSRKIHEFRDRVFHCTIYPYIQ